MAAAGADAAAYRVEGGGWRAPDDVQNFSFAASGAYEVAVRCGYRVYVFAFTTGDLEELSVPCRGARQSASFTVAYDASALNSANKVSLYYPGGIAGSNSGQVSGTFDLTGRVGTQDFVLLAFDRVNKLIAAGMRTADVSDGCRYSIAMEAGDTGHLKPGGSLADFSRQVPSGWSRSLAHVTAVAPNETLISVFRANDANGGDYTSFDFVHHEVAVASASEGAGNPTKSIMQRQISDAVAYDFRVTLPAVFDAGVSHEALPTFSGLNRSEADLLGYHLQIQWSSYRFIDALVSRAFLGENTSYSLPDLS